MYNGRDRENNFLILKGEKWKKKLVLGALCVSMILASGIGASAEVSKSHSQWAEESLISADEAGLLPNFFADRDLTANISRIDFCHLAYKMLEQNH